jgi:outer membrane protein assembly factor BamB
MQRGRKGLASEALSVLCVLLCLFVFFVANPLGAAEPWTTYRGNPERTGSPDGQAGPAAPKVLWVLPSKEHFIASPVPAGDRVYISGLGPFNVPTFYALALDPKGPQRALWAKTTPYLKLPTVSSPAVVDGRLVFGDGMHQTDGATLHCLAAEKGLPLWQLPVPGTLVHLEGSPTVSGGRAYLGGGNAGVLCVDVNRVTLDGKEMDLPTIQKILEKKWAELLAKYEEDKKKDPDFAVPPSEDQLPKPAPVKLWQQGADRWHVDAPVAVAGDRVLVASAYLDKEKLGDRSLYCLDARTGEVQWQAKLRLNPWGGPTVAGDLVVVGGSTIGYDPKSLKGAKGEVTAIDLKSGTVKWQKDVPGGVVSCVAVADGLAVATATDGKVRTFNLADGDRRTILDGKTPFFAPPAVAKGVAYVGDLAGVVTAVPLTGGAPKWTLDLGTAPEVKAPGMIYGGPAVQGGRLIVATANLEGPNAGKPTAVLCIGDK